LDQVIVTVGFLEIGQQDRVTSEEMKRIEDAGAKIGISKSLMMENAGSCIARFIFQNVSYLRSLGNSKVLKILFVAGTGNNGGDAFVAARHLAYWKNEFEISVVLVGLSGEIKAEEAKSNFQILQNIPEIKVVQISDESKVTAFAGLLSNADVVVGAIFGTGFKGEPRALQKCIIEMINMNSNAVKISVDLPSGLEADTGNSVLAIHSDFTITMYAAKSGMLSNQSATGLCGRILVANIGVPR
jgi:hydroxyethylthiazole kinase-like uncharacterized protein yjeF